MTNQALLPKKGKNILDSMFNQLWEYGEKGPTIELPSWCQMAIDSINAFENSLMDAWTEVYDCWEREFLTRLWSIQVEHHGGGTDGIITCVNNWLRLQELPVTTQHDHTHIVPSGTSVMSPGPLVIEKDAPTEDVIINQRVETETAASTGWDSFNLDTCALKGHLVCPGHLGKLLKPVCVSYKVNDIEFLSCNYRAFVKELCQWMVSAIEAIGIKQAAISAVMADPTLNGNCTNAGCQGPLKKINDLREKNNDLLAKVEHAYGIYSDVNNMKNKKEYDEEIALHELQPNKYSNEDMQNMGSSIQSESNETGLDAELCQGGIDICALRPWKHLSLSENKVKPKCLPSKCACNKFDKIIESVAGFESWFSK